MEANKCVNITECQKCVINGTEYQVSLRFIGPLLGKITIDVYKEIAISFIIMRSQEHIVSNTAVYIKY